MKRAERRLLIVFMNWVLLAPIVQAAERVFYQGKNVNFVINFAAGGPTDIEGRIVALRQKVMQVSNEIVDFVRQYVEQARK
jgi:tripartite-type tricarboxylate transporter receptor subunit TctC